MHEDILPKLTSCFFFPFPFFKVLFDGAKYLYVNDYLKFSVIVIYREIWNMKKVKELILI